MVPEIVGESLNMLCWDEQLESKKRSIILCKEQKQNAAKIDD